MKERPALGFIYLFTSFILITDGLHEGEEVHPTTAINTRNDLEMRGKEKEPSKDLVKERDLHYKKETHEDRQLQMHSVCVSKVLPSSLLTLSGASTVIEGPMLGGSVGPGPWLVSDWAGGSSNTWVCLGR